MGQDILKHLIHSTKEKRCSVIRYDGQQAIRVVEPHVIYTDKQGNILVECLQTRGYSSADAKFPFWQTFYLSKINSVYLLDINFQIRVDQGFNSNRPEYHQGLLAIAQSGRASQAEQADKPPQLLLYQARDWMWEMGQAIDKALTGRDGKPGDKP